MRLIQVICISSVIGFLACDHPFTTRKPEKPNTSQSSWIPPHSPEDVLINLMHAVEERNSENYMRCFLNEPEVSHPFCFDPDPEAAALYPFLLEWTQSQEENIIKQTFFLVPQDSGLSLQFPKEIRDVIAADSAVIVREYEWNLHHGIASLPERLEGQAEMRMAENSVSEWGIYRWIDNRITEVPCLSLWKATLLGGAT
jgi:hypothetical protein